MRLPSPATVLTVPVAFAAVADTACILAFAAVGRASHAEDGGVVGVVTVAWPFLAGAALGWAMGRAWRAPHRLWPQGVTVWAVTWAGGMTLRGLTGGGLAPSFLLVAAASLGVLLLGWRAIAVLVSAGRARATQAPSRA
ncbi:DUF3054 domain-containing protein [Pengzhenrongella sicca]|uniref:DUF3054 domain-containing protein n=1 Tax=Pengzhenrongella sicca TaxID=2819238 RepID=A0A8A4ZG91_9MICO|nr:DUF3054 domain-containing protein [Pengzhenrongella sicca]QTE30411.1 DUF3054 domain-containing protein [Pengzhenrongella sicca]